VQYLNFKSYYSKRNDYPNTSHYGDVNYSDDQSQMLYRLL